MEIELSSKLIQKLNELLGVDNEASFEEVSDRNSLYWEKTVEWTFASKYFNSNGSSHHFAPLGGKAEGGGDVLVHDGNGDRWFLIEFKRDRDGFKSEKKNIRYLKPLRDGDV